MQDGHKKVFISYAWSNQSRVISIVEKLRSNGVDTVFDLQDFKHGTDKYQFMESSVNDPSVDYILVFSSKEYARKANAREGGVGEEAQILSKEAYDLSKNKVQVILLEREVDQSECLPTYLDTKKYFDFSKPEREEFEFEQLIRFIYDKPLYKKTALGPIPAFLDEEKVDLYPLREELSRLPIGSVRRFSRFIDEVTKKILETISDNDINENNYLTYYNQLQSIRMLCVDYAIRYYENGGNISDFSIRLIECVVNCCPLGSPEVKIDLIYSLTHELLVCMVALTLYYEELEETKAILANKYSVNSPYREGTTFVTYTDLYHHSRYFEFVNKKENRNLINLQAEQMIAHTQYPHITQDTLSTADLIMHHLRPILSSRKDYWFPLLYTYFKGGIKMWGKLESKTYCEYFKKIFSIDEERLIDIITNNPYGDSIKHERSWWKSAPWINEFIDVRKIGKDV